MDDFVVVVGGAVRLIGDSVTRDRKCCDTYPNTRLDTHPSMVVVLLLMVFQCISLVLILSCCRILFYSTRKGNINNGGEYSFRLLGAYCPVGDARAVRRRQEQTAVAAHAHLVRQVKDNHNVVTSYGKDSSVQRI